MWRLSRPQKYTRIPRSVSRVTGWASSRPAVPTHTLSTPSSGARWARRPPPGGRGGRRPPAPPPSARQSPKVILQGCEGADPPHELDDRAPEGGRHVRPGDLAPPEGEEAAKDDKDHEGEVQDHQQVCGETIKHSARLPTAPGIQQRRGRDGPQER